MGQRPPYESLAPPRRCKKSLYITNSTISSAIGQVNLQFAVDQFHRIHVGMFPSVSACQTPPLQAMQFSGVIDISPKVRCTDTAHTHTLMSLEKERSIDAQFGTTMSPDFQRECIYVNKKSTTNAL